MSPEDPTLGRSNITPLVPFAVPAVDTNLALAVQKRAVATSVLGARVKAEVDGLLSVIQMSPELPDAIHERCGTILALMAGDGTPGSDVRPQSMEQVNDPALHAKALIEAKARSQGYVENLQRAVDELKPGDAELAVRFDERVELQREEVLQSYDLGKEHGREEAAAKWYPKLQEAEGWIAILESESVWAHLKRKWRKLMSRNDPRIDPLQFTVGEVSAKGYPESFRDE